MTLYWIVCFIENVCILYEAEFSVIRLYWVPSMGAWCQSLESAARYRLGFSRGLGNVCGMNELEDIEKIQPWQELFATSDSIKPLYKVFCFKMVFLCVCVSLYRSVFRNNSTHVWDIIQTIMMFHVNFDAEILQIENNPKLIQSFVSPQPAPLPSPTPHHMPPPPHIRFSRNTSLEDCWLALNINPKEFIPTVKRTSA